MPEVIQVQGLAESTSLLRSIPPSMRRAGFVAASAGAQELLSYMKRNMLSGQRLKVQTGKLRSNWAQNLPRNEGPIEAFVFTNTVYAPRHEYGFSGTETVREHTRRPARKRSRSGKLVRKRSDKDAAPITVRSFTRQANTPAKHYLRDSVRMDEARVGQIVRHYMRRGFLGEQT